MRTGTPNTLLLHRYQYGELEGEELEYVRRAITEDPETRRRWQAIQAAEAEHAVAPLPPALAALRDPPPPSPWRRWLTWAMPMGGVLAAAAAVLLVVGLPGGSPEVQPTEAPYIGTKGSLPDLEVWVGSDAGPRPLRQGEAVGEGDAVQLAFDARGARFVTLAGRDGTGTLEIYRTLETGGQRGLITAPFSLVLDDAPGPQRFLVLGHDEPLSEEALRARLEAGEGELRTVTLQKR